MDEKSQLAQIENYFDESDPLLAILDNTHKNSYEEFENYDANNEPQLGLVDTNFEIETPFNSN